MKSHSASDPAEVGTQFSKGPSSREYLWVRLHESLDVLVHLLLQLFPFLLFLAIFAISRPEGSCQLHLSNHMSKICCVDVNLEPAVHYPGLSFRDKIGARLQHFFDAKSVCRDSQVLFDDLLYCIVAI